MAPSWSPDGEQIIFYALRGDDTELYLINADGSDERQLTDNEFPDRNPDFSPDGEWIVFQSNRAGNEVFDIFMMNLAGDDVRQLTFTASDDEAPAWRP